MKSTRSADKRVTRRNREREQLVGVAGWVRATERSVAAFCPVEPPVHVHFFRGLIRHITSLLLGGNSGFTDFKFIPGYDLRAPSMQRGLCLVTGHPARQEQEQGGDASDDCHDRFLNR